MKAPALLKPLTNRVVLVLSICIALAYLLIQIYALNNGLIIQTILGSFSPVYKLTVLSQLIEGYFVMFPLRETLFNIITALLVGINLVLIISLTQRAKKFGSMKLSLGGTGLLAVVSSGCPSCGITALSLLGPSSSFVGIFLHSSIVQIVIVGILIISIIHSLRSLKTAQVCKI